MACAAAVATIDVIEKEGLLKNAAERGVQLTQGWRGGARGYRELCTGGTGSRGVIWVIARRTSVARWEGGGGGAGTDYTAGESQRGRDQDRMGVRRRFRV